MSTSKQASLLLAALLVSLVGCGEGELTETKDDDQFTMEVPDDEAFGGDPSDLLETDEAALTSTTPYYVWKNRNDNLSSPYNQCSPNLVQLLAYMKSKWGGQSLGCHLDRTIAGSSTLSTHAWGAALDYLPNGGNATGKASVFPFLIAHSAELRINTIHDYVRQAMWKPNLGWVAANIGSSGGQWMHIEVTPAGFLDSRTVEQRLSNVSPVNCFSATTQRTLPANTCVQAASDAKTYRCSSSGWVPYTGTSCANPSYPFCHSATLGRYVPARTCVQARSDRVWYQCVANGSWDPAPKAASAGSGPLGNCSSVHAL
jgi:hypothetical protein